MKGQELRSGLLLFGVPHLSLAFHFWMAIQYIYIYMFVLLVGISFNYKH